MSTAKRPTGPLGHRPLRLLAVCAALAVPALASVPRAAAQPTAQGGPAQVDAAALAKQRDLFQQANKLWDEGKFPQAEALYKQAWAMKKSYDVAGNYGNLLADMGKPRPAAELLSFALREFPAGGRPALRDALLKRLGEVTRLVGTLRIEVKQPEAEVFLDGQPVGKAPLTGDIYVDSGTHQIEARKQGFFPAQETIEIAKGKSLTVKLALREPQGPNKTIVYAGGGVAGAALIAGAVLTAIGATKKTDDLRSTALRQGGCPAFAEAQPAGACADLKAAINSKATLTTAGVYTLVGGAAVGVATLVYGFVGGEKAPAASARLRVLPVVGGDGAGLVVGGTF